MTKATVTRLFIGGLVAVAAGTIVAIAAVWLAIGNNVFVMSGADIVGIQGGVAAWTLLGLGLVGGVAFAAGVLAGFVSWIGALFNTWQLESRTWFAVLLLLGIFNFGFLAMIGYLIAGPDGTSVARRTSSAASAA